MGSSLKSNPIFQRIKSSSRGPSIPRLMLIGATVVLISIPASIYLFFAFLQNPLKVDLFGIISGLPFLASAVFPLLFANLTSFLIFRQVRDGIDHLIQITPVSRAELLLGYISGIFYQQRTLYAVLITWILISTVLDVPYAHAYLINDVRCLEPLLDCLKLVHADANYAFNFATKFMLFHLFLSLNVTIFSSCVTYRWKDIWLSIGVSSLYCVAFMISYYIIMYLIDQSYIVGMAQITYSHTYLLIEKFMFLVLVLLSFFFYRLTFNHLRTAND